LPLVYNSGGYDSVKTLEILDGIIDIYMPDTKYSDEKTAEELSGIKNYPAINQAALREMHRQTGDLQTDEDGIAMRGLLIRHLVLPHGLAGTKEIMKFIAKDISPNSYVNVMAQYHPHHKAFQTPQLARPLLKQEFLEAIELAERAGLNRLDRFEPVTARAI
jgi:putative pyruvate formate lyase activating enzyme